MKQREPDCLYCTGNTRDDVKGESEHFQCDECGRGMCDDCYNTETDHYMHYNQPYTSPEWADEREPEYLCDDCTQYYKYDETI